MLYKIYEYLAKVVIHWLYDEGKRCGVGELARFTIFIVGMAIYCRIANPLIVTDQFTGYSYQTTSINAKESSIYIFRRYLSHNFISELS